MKNAKRNVLISSVITIVLCISLIAGGTYAWFTDTAKVDVNKVVSGKLDVALEMEEGSEWVSAEGKTLSFLRMSEDGTLTADEAVIFEPGATYRLPALRVKNNGNLAVKYKVSISGAAGDLKLLDALTFTLGDEAENISAGDVLLEATLLPGGTGDELSLTVRMSETAGNEYQNLTLENIAVTVYATQAANESDSTGSAYDKDAQYPVDNAAGLKNAITKGGVCNVTGEVVYGELTDTAADRFVIAAPTTLQLEARIKSPDNMGDYGKNFAALYVQADTVINAKENGGIDTGVNGGYCIDVLNGAKLVINGGIYNGLGTAVQVQKGELLINGGFFDCTPFDEPYGYQYVINCVDAPYKNGTAKVSIQGGTFVNFNPADNGAEGSHTNFVADGYKVVTETKDNGDIWYTVVPAND